MCIRDRDKGNLRARGLAGYDIAFTRRRSPVRIRPCPSFFWRTGAKIVSDDEDDKTEELPTADELPTSAEDEETNKEATDEQERQKKPLERAIQVTSLVDYAAALIREERAAYLANIGRDKQAVSTSDAPKLRFSESDLNNFVSLRKTGLAEKSLDWIDRASMALWESTKGEISQRTLRGLRESILDKYTSPDSHSKVLSFAKGFLTFLAKTRREPQFTSFEPYLDCLLYTSPSPRDGLLSRMPS